MTDEMFNVESRPSGQWVWSHCVELSVGADVNRKTPMITRHDPMVSPHPHWTGDAFRMVYQAISNPTHHTRIRRGSFPHLSIGCEYFDVFVPKKASTPNFSWGALDLPPSPRALVGWHGDLWT